MLVQIQPRGPRAFSSAGRAPGEWSREVVGSIPTRRAAHVTSFKPVCSYDTRGELAVSCTVRAMKQRQTGTSLRRAWNGILLTVVLFRVLLEISLLSSEERRRLG